MKSIMNLFDEVHRKENTIIIVTHEEEIAQHAQRIIKLRDGKVETDYLNEHKFKL